MIGARFGAGRKPVEIPADRIGPLLELPLFAGSILAAHILSPEDLGSCFISLEVISQAEILKPFQDEEKPGALRVGQASKLGEIFSPTPTHNCCFHEQ